MKNQEKVWHDLALLQKTPTSWNAACLEWEARGWCWEQDKENGEYRMQNDWGNPGVITFGLQNDRCYLQVSYNDDTEFSNPLKEEFGGRNTSGKWRHDLPAPFESMTNEELVDAIENEEKLQNWLLRLCCPLVMMMERFHCTMEWKKAVAERLRECPDWKVYIWRWGMLACQCENESLGRPYMDIVGWKGNFIIQLANRHEDNDLLRKTLERLKRLKHFEHLDMRLLDDHDPKEYVVVGKVPVTDIPALANRVMEVVEAL